MARGSCEELLEKFCRQGIRTYREASELLRACGFEERRTKSGHALWTQRDRGSCITIAMTEELKPCYKAEIKRAIQQLRLED